MPANINSASRIVKLFREIPHHPENTSTLEVWATAFQVPAASSQRKGHLVAQRLGMINQELEIVRAQMAAKNFSESLFSPCIDATEHACSALILHTTWTQVRQYMSGETFLGLGFCAEILDNEETEIPSEELAELGRRITELERLLEISTLPARLKQLIRSHLVLIQTAIAEYPICGAKSFRQAARAGIGELIEIKDEVQGNSDAVEVSMMEAIWGTLNQATDEALKSGPRSRLGNKSWGIFDAIGNGSNITNYELKNG